MSVSVDGTYWSVIVFNKDQLTHPACVQFMGENQQYVSWVHNNVPDFLAKSFNVPAVILDNYNYTIIYNTSLDSFKHI